MKKKIVEVSWRDPTIDAGWIEDNKSHDKLLPILRVYGILVSKTRKQIVIAGGYDSVEKKYCDRSKFPAGCVERVRTIEVVDL